MSMYQMSDITKSVECGKCGAVYTQTLCEYVGGPKYWSGTCPCTPTSYDSIAIDLKDEIRSLGGDVSHCEWDIELINNINNTMRGRLRGKPGGKYREVKEFLYPVVYPFKKSIGIYINEDEKSFLKKYSGIDKREVYIKEVLKISIDEYIHYLNYLLYLRNN